MARSQSSTERRDTIRDADKISNNYSPFFACLYVCIFMIMKCFVPLCHQLGKLSAQYLGPTTSDYCWSATEGNAGAGGSTTLKIPGISARRKDGPRGMPNPNLR